MQVFVFRRVFTLNLPTRRVVCWFLILAVLCCLAPAHAQNGRRVNVTNVGEWPGWARNNSFGVSVVGNLAFVAATYAGLQILDVSDPAGPVGLGGYDTLGSAVGVQVVGSLAYVADSDGGLLILDVSNPSSPVRVGGYDTSGYVRCVQVVGSLAYVADGSWGLQVLALREPASQAIDFPAIPDLVLTNAALLLSATTSSGLPVTYQVVSGPATINGNVLTLIGPGHVIVRAIQAGNDHYYGTSVEVSFEVLLEPPPEARLSMRLDPGSQGLILSWPASSIGFVLEFTPALLPAAWQATAVAPTRDDDLLKVLLPLSANTGFYRLRK